MAINKNHEFEDLENIKCSVVEKNVPKERVAFLKQLLEFNGYTVLVVLSPPAKAAPAPKPVEGENEIVETPTVAKIETYTVGVTDVMFNATNAIFGRFLKTNTGHIITLAYWQQKEQESTDNIPYFANDENIQSWK